jgi:putative hydrolase of the HAD superfamily
MVDRPFDLIAFDGDDTLWHNERSYREARERFRRLLAGAGVELTDDDIETRVNETELANIPFYGYGVSSFVLSLIETAIALTSGRVTGDELGELIALGKEMLSAEVELFPGVRDVVTHLAQRYPLMLITKGDLLHQTSKLQRSGLRPYFHYVEVVSHKTPDIYASLLSQYGIVPERFLMVGNSLRSDVLPVIEAGGRAAYVPAALTWAHEHADVPETARSRFVELSGLNALTCFVETLEAREGGIAD